MANEPRAEFVGVGRHPDQHPTAEGQRHLTALETGLPGRADRQERETVEGRGDHLPGNAVTSRRGGEHKLKNLESEIEAIVKSHEAQGEADRQRLKDETEKSIERLLREVDFTIHQESLKAQKDIRAAAVGATLEMAEELVKNRITDADRRRLADEYITRIGKNGASA